MAWLAYSRMHPIVGLARPQDGAWEAMLKAGRTRFGGRTVTGDRAGMRRLLETLRAGGSVGAMPDQDPPRGSGVFAPFMGIMANSPVYPVRLARRTAATILYVYAERLSRGRGYVLHIEPAPPEVADEDEVRAVGAVNRGVEACIRRIPAQYYWAYMRFRRRPAGEPPFYPW
jgi:KDO2-lipid IV(A) lauroyltransferase